MGVVALTSPALAEPGPVAGPISRWVTGGTPSDREVESWRMPCQWMEAGSPSKLKNSTMMRSPTAPLMVGPGNLPLSRMAGRSLPSGLTVPQVATSLYLRCRGLTRPQTRWQEGELGDAARTHDGMEQK